VLPNFFHYHPAPSSCGTDDALLFHQQYFLFSQGWRMALHTTVEDQVIDVLHRTQMCDLEEVTRQCTNLTWNQVFLAVDHLSRSGEIMLVPMSRGMYALTFPHRKGGRPDRHSLPY
jgi:hypothetical protein